MCGGPASMVIMGKQCSKGQGKAKKKKKKQNPWETLDFFSISFSTLGGTAKLLVWGMNEQSLRVGCKSVAKK